MKKNCETLKKEPFDVIVSDNCEELEESVAKLKIELEFMGHYNEPVLTMEYELPDDGTPKLEDWLLLYNPMTGIWKTEKFEETVNGSVNNKGCLVS